MVRGGGIIVCIPCSTTETIDYMPPKTAILGSNFDAERSGFSYIDGSTKLKYLRGWPGRRPYLAHNLPLTGPIQSNSPGVLITSDATAEHSSSYVSGYNIGVNAFQSGFITVNGYVISGNSDSSIAAVQ